MTERAFIVPADLPGPSGGSIYNLRVLEAWRDVGMTIPEVAIPGAWPRPSLGDRESLRAAIQDHDRVLIDGIIASAAPQEISEATARGTEVAILVHLPLPAESGLSSTEQNALAAGERAAVQAASAVVATSRWARDDLQSRYGLTTVAVAEPGVQPATLSTGGTPPQLMFLGAVTPRKNPLLLIEALRKLSHLRWNLVIAGPLTQDPEYAAKMHDAARGLSPERVTVTGPVDGRDLEELWQRTDLLALPSLAETYGMVVTEALARSIPALVGAGTGAAEALLGHPGSARSNLGAPGAAIDPRDTAAWGQTLQTWLEDDTLRRRWHTAAGHHRARLRTWSEAAQELRTAIHW